MASHWHGLGLGLPLSCEQQNLFACLERPSDVCRRMQALRVSLFLPRFEIRFVVLLHAVLVGVYVGLVENDLS